MITDMLENENIAGSINRTNESIIKRQRRELAEKDKTLKEKEREHQRELQEKERILEEKDALINELKRQLASKKFD